jgi:hypothetical protein
MCHRPGQTLTLLSRLDAVPAAAVPGTPVHRFVAGTNWLSARSNATTLPGAGLCLVDFGLCSRADALLVLPEGGELEMFSAQPLSLDATGGLQAAYAPPARVSEPVNGASYVATALRGWLRVPAAEYQALPVRFVNGYTVQQVVHISAETLLEGGMFWYRGTGAASKFWQVDPLSSGPLPHLDSPPQEVSPSNPMAGLEYNGEGLLVRPDGRLAYWWLDEVGRSHQVYTQPGVITPGWVDITMTWCPGENLAGEGLAPSQERLACAPSRLGTLRVLVNAKTVLEQEGIPEQCLRSLPGPEYQQVGVPYQLVWGQAPGGLSRAYLPTGGGRWRRYEGPVTALEEVASAMGVGLGVHSVYDGAAHPLQVRQLHEEFKSRIAVNL